MNRKKNRKRRRCFIAARTTAIDTDIPQPKIQETITSINIPHLMIKKLLSTPISLKLIFKKSKKKRKDFLSI